MKHRNIDVWTNWVNRTIDNVDYAFDHLVPFEMLLQRPATGALPAMALSIRVVFDCHVVTESCDQDYEVVAEDPAYWADTGNQCRRFVPARHAQSQQLPEFLRSLVTGKVKCYQAKSNNYMTWKIQNGTVNQHYQVYFDLYRPADANYVVLYVQSAYLKDTPTSVQRKNQVVFATLCAKTMGFIAPPRKGPTNKGKKR